MIDVTMHSCIGLFAYLNGADSYTRLHLLYLHLDDMNRFKTLLKKVLKKIAIKFEVQNELVN